MRFLCFLNDALALRLCALPVLAAVAGCADIDLPQWASGEPSVKEGTSLRPDFIRRDPEHAAWPNLATVPPKPAPALVTPPAQRQQTMQEMMKDSRAAPPPVDIAPVR